MDANLLDKMLTAYREQKTPVTIVLQNKARVSGKVQAFDNYVIILENGRNEIVYRHAISSLAPGRAAEHPRPPQQRPEQMTAASKPVRQAAPTLRKHRAGKTVPVAPKTSAASGEHTTINTGMKEGLLRWMKEQKASK
jgi:host factor-I protein